ncbi:MAG TPA: BlaI/MecI/CopY family transcriptional regulator [Candidatus Sulfotelmatobacter sp.]|nr:BlaI/MecI/CopY family transcriptional regulator [Candidatus Sulfotelmatobacter sp.]
MKPVPRISETEWEVMKIVWRQSPVSASQVIEGLKERDPSWHEQTVKTLLNRLIKKGALGYRKEGRAYWYRPLVSEDESVRAASQSFLQRVFGGSLQPLLAHFVESHNLSTKEVNELTRLLKGKERK